MLVVLSHDKLKSFENGFHCIFYCVFDIGNIIGFTYREDPHLHSWLVSSLLLVLDISTFCRVAIVVIFTNKIGFTSIGAFICKSYCRFSVLHQFLLEAARTIRGCPVGDSGVYTPEVPRLSATGDSGLLAGVPGLHLVRTTVFSGLWPEPLGRP